MKEDRRRLIASLEIVTGVGLILFWIAFFTIGLAPEKPPACYFAYEHSFPLPDSLLAVLLLLAGIQLMRDRKPGYSLSLVAAGALMFLGILDFSFNILNGVYLVSTLDLIMNAFINIWCLGFGLTMVIVLKDSL
jgi:hypothetical protein